MRNEPGKNRRRRKTYKLHEGRGECDRIIQRFYGNADRECGVPDEAPARVRTRANVMGRNVSTDITELV